MTRTGIFAALIFSCNVWAQSYNITTIAGGGVPANWPPATEIFLYLQNAATDAAGNVYFTNFNTILKLSAATGLISTVAGTGNAGYSGDNGPAAAAQVYLPRGLAADASGNLYFADTLNNCIRKISRGTVTTIAGNGFAAFGGDGGPALSAEMNFPTGVAVDAAGRVYFSDSRNYRVRMISNGIMTTVAGNGTAGFSGDNASATAAQLNNPTGLAVDSAGALYISDTTNERVRKVSNGIITTVAADPHGFFGPGGLALDSADDLYIADSGGTIRVLTDGTMTIIAGGPRNGFGDGGPASDAQFQNPTDVCLDQFGNVYVVDDYNGRIRKITNGIITTVAGGGTDFTTFWGNNGPATSATLGEPYGVAVDAAGTLYISDGSYRILKVTNGVLTTVAGTGVRGFSGDGGPAINAQFDGPQGLAIDSAGNLYIADSGNNRVREISNGIITTVAGNGTPGVAGDNGSATAAELDRPADLAFDSTGNLYIADMGNSRVRMVSHGRITTIAGTAYPGSAADNIPATSAQLNEVTAIAVDSRGVLYIVDNINHKVRQVVNQTISTVPGTNNNVPFQYMMGLVTDHAGNLYVSDGIYIRRFANGVGTVVAGVGGSGSCGYVWGDNGPATNSSICSNYLAIDSAGDIYVSDGINERIRLLLPTGFPCAASVAPATFDVSPRVREITVTVRAASTCPWWVYGATDWLSLSSASALGSSAELDFSIAPNQGDARTVTLSIGGIIGRYDVNVNQSTNSTSCPPGSEKRTDGKSACDQTPLLPRAPSARPR